VDDAPAGEGAAGEQATGELVDADSRFRLAYGIAPDGAVLVRPDGFIAWRAADASGASAGRVAGVLSRVLCRADADSGEAEEAGEADVGGDPVCWAHLVCDECGAITTEGHRAGCSRQAATAG
jgi:hypothetical protein